MYNKWYITRFIAESNIYIFYFKTVISYQSHLGHAINILTRLPVTRFVKLRLNFELINFPNQLY